MTTKQRSNDKTASRKAAGARPKSVSQAVAESRYLTTEEVAQLLRVSVSSVVGWRTSQKRDSPPFIKVGHSVRYDKTALDQWLESRKHQY
jgi:excisionase family DNA binding protein